MTYHLEKYKGGSSRHTCPKCGKPKSFTYYVDEDGNPLDESVGRCNHESGCGYHYPPKQFFEDHPERNSTYKPERIFKPISIISPVKQSRSIDTIPATYVARSRSNGSHLMQFLFSMQEGNEEAFSRTLDAYRIGATKNGETIFWQIDKENRVRGGKVISYNKEDGHRIKDKGVNWVHCLLKRQGVFNEEWTLCQCLFGENLLAEAANERKVIAVVESEKTAVICAIQYPDYVWLATGGKSQLSHDKMKVLAGRSVILFPDVDGYHEWVERAKSFGFCRSVKVSDFLEKNAADADRKAKIDIADLILRQWQARKENRRNPAREEAERILAFMIAKNPALQTLIDALDLELQIDDG